jgi:hypothetical protein
LSKALSTHCISRHGATNVASFGLAVKVNFDAYRLTEKNNLSNVMYHDLMMNTIDEVTDKRIKVINV